MHKIRFNKVGFSVLKRSKTNQCPIEELSNAILAQMRKLCNTLPEYSAVKSMNCIGDTLAPRIIAEIGGVRRFNNKHSLIAYAGIDSPPYQSGTFNVPERHISKRGNSYLRKTGYEIMQSDAVIFIDCFNFKLLGAVFSACIFCFC
ncbi:MAG: IS110 family transposase [Eubacterium sp.]|nr:IS110 family transposase [Eubacterium sp.]